MKNKQITHEDIADAIINLNENLGYCDKDTANGFKTSNKKEILKSKSEHSFSRFTSEIIKRQTKKDWRENNDN